MLKECSQEKRFRGEGSPREQRKKIITVHLDCGPASARVQGGPWGVHGAKAVSLRGKGAVYFHIDSLWAMGYF